MIAYKLVSVKKDGSIGPLLVGKKIRFPINKWMKAKNLKPKGFKIRPGFHCCPTMNAPHLTKKNRVWTKIEIKDFKTFKTPKSHGGIWYVAKMMKIKEIL